LGLTVNRVGHMKSGGLMEGIASPSRGDGWNWKAERTNPPSVKAEETGAAPDTSERSSGAAASGGGSAVATDAAPLEQGESRATRSTEGEPGGSRTTGDNELVPVENRQQIDIGGPTKEESSNSQEMSALDPGSEAAQQRPSSPSEKQLPASDPDDPAPMRELSANEERPPAPAAEAAKREPRIYGSENDNSRIVVRATEDSWIEVVDADGKLLFSRVLRGGDSYRAPAVEGARFVTGNAGGLEILVDGERAPPLGPSATVRRDIPLDPDLLMAGADW
jgi:cytoskeletal protein RodZ